MKHPLTDIPGIGESTAILMAKHGIDSVKALQKGGIRKLTRVPGFGEVRAATVLAAAEALENSGKKQGKIEKTDKLVDRAAKKAAKAAKKEAGKAEKKARKAAKQAEKDARKAVKAAEKEAEKARKEAKKAAKKAAKSAKKDANKVKNEARKAAKANKPRKEKK
ncbi:MAG TPA: helix-hairpin-helix domain-containing protein [Mariprofundaceae bacterium]|nr:helix-hairpin-helix domain-containing protein [Mariprofundaceae bacterium]